MEKDEVHETGMSNITEEKAKKNAGKNSWESSELNSSSSHQFPSPENSNIDGEVILQTQPSSSSVQFNRLLPIYTLDWASRNDSYFMPATGLDFLIGVSEVILLQTVVDMVSLQSKFLVKIPNGETLYLGIENSSSLQRATFCSQRSFNMSFLDPGRQEAASFIRKSAFTNYLMCFRQEMEIYVPERHFPIGRILQDRSLCVVSFTVFDENHKVLYKINTSKKSYFWKLDDDVYFTILDPVHRTCGLIVHKWDNTYSDFIYQITFPANDTTLNHKMILIGTALLVEYTYFKKSKWFCNSM